MYRPLRSALLLCTAAAALFFTPAYAAEEKTLAETSDTLGKDGGSVVLKEYATLTLPQGWSKKPAAQKITLRAVRDSSNLTTFETARAMYESGAAEQEIIVDVGQFPPEKPLPVTLNVPKDFTLPKGHAYVIYDGEESGGADESEFSFEPEGATQFNAKDNTVSVEIPREAFTKSFSDTGTYQAFIILGTMHK